MGTEQDYRELFDRVAALREQVASRMADELTTNPQLGDALLRQIDEMLESVDKSERTKPVAPDGGLAQLVGVGPDAVAQLGQTQMPRGVEAYDDTVASERVIAVGDLYYIYQHERIGVFRVVQKLQELFQGGAIRLSDGPGAFALYRFDRRDVLRYTMRDRIMAYRRVLGYGKGTGSANSRPNVDFHRLFAHFNNQVALFWRDKRISDVVRSRAYDPSFGSIAIVRRAGLDMRNNLKFTSYGHLNVLRVEVMQLLAEAFRILNSDDVKDLFGAANAWDVVDEVLIRYFDERLVTSPRQRMGVTGRQVLRWLATSHVLESSRAEFEQLLLEIAEPAEEWLTSAQSLRVAERTEAERVVPWDQHRPVGVAAAPRVAKTATRPTYPRRGGLGAYRGTGLLPARASRNGTPHGSRNGSRDGKR
jgi:hypothetical protein